VLTRLSDDVSIDHNWRILLVTTRIFTYLVTRVHAIHADTAPVCSGMSSDLHADSDAQRFAEITTHTNCSGAAQQLVQLASVPLPYWPVAIVCH